MPKVKIIFLGILKSLATKREDKIETKGNTLGDVLDEIIRIYGQDIREHMFDSKTGSLWKGSSILVNRFERADHLNSEIKDGDVIILSPPMGSWSRF